MNPKDDEPEVPEEGIQVNLEQQKIELLRRERNLMEQEINLLRRENIIKIVTLRCFGRITSLKR